MVRPGNSDEERESPAGTIRPLTRWYMNPLASNPGLLSLSFSRYWRCFPLFTTLHLVGPALSIVLALLVHWVFALAAFAWLLILVLFWIQRYVIADGGDLCPAMIVHTEPYRIAIRADLTFGLDSWPVIKVIEQPLGRTRMQPLAVGARLPAVATYYRLDGLNYWADIDAFAAPCLTDDRSAVDRAVRRIPEEEWQALQRDWTELNRPDLPGLYHLRPQGSCHFPLRRWRHARANPLLPIITLLLVVGPFIASIFYPAWWVWGLSVLGVLFWWLWGLSAEQTARYGFPCAAKLIDEKVGLIAIYADLSASDGFYPAIKVIEIPSWLVRLAGLTEGDRVAMVALFTNKDSSGNFWTDLTPELVQALTDDPGEAERVLARLPAEAWQFLDAGLRQLGWPLKPGVHRQSLPGAEWPDLQRRGERRSGPFRE